MNKTTNTETKVTITARFFLAGWDKQPMYMADGPDGHLSLVARTTEEAATRDGEAYFLATREFVDGKWRIAGL